MNWVEQFIRWFNRMGGRVPPSYEEAINDRYIYDPPKVSNLKARADYIKTKVNYKFHKNEENRSKGKA